MLGFRAGTASIRTGAIGAWPAEDIRAGADIAVTIANRGAGSLTVSGTLPFRIRPQRTGSTVLRPAADPVLVGSFVFAAALVEVLKRDSHSYVPEKA